MLTRIYYCSFIKESNNNSTQKNEGGQKKLLHRIYFNLINSLSLWSCSHSVHKIEPLSAASYHNPPLFLHFQWAQRFPLSLSIYANSSCNMFYGFARFCTQLTHTPYEHSIQMQIYIFFVKTCLTIFTCYHFSHFHFQRLSASTFFFHIFCVLLLLGEICILKCEELCAVDRTQMKQWKNFNFTKIFIIYTIF